MSALRCLTHFASLETTWEANDERERCKANEEKVYVNFMSALRCLFYSTLESTREANDGEGELGARKAKIEIRPNMCIIRSLTHSKSFKGS